jgi:hypothetical protein
MVSPKVEWMGGKLVLKLTFMSYLFSHPCIVNFQYGIKTRFLLRYGDIEVVFNNF